MPLALIAVTLSWAVSGPNPTGIDKRTQLTLDDMRTFTEVFAHIQQDYVEETNDRELMENAIRGMLRELDPHTTYLDREEYADLEVDTSGRYGGIGIEAAWLEEQLTIAAITPGGPAQRGGLESGDIIEAIDQHRVTRMSPSMAIRSVRGEPGTVVALQIRRGDRQHEYSLVREVIAMASVESRLFDEQVGYLKIESFQTNTADSAKTELDRLKALADDHLEGLVLDLRGNPGGVLTAAVGLADLFLTDGSIVSIQGRTQQAQMHYSAGPQDELSGAPIVIIVDRGTASASEIVAGALQDHDRALVLGQRTFGKGSVQTVLPLQNGGAIKLTTSRYYTPNGRSIQAAGIEPDIDIGKVESNPGSNQLPREVELSNHLAPEAAPTPRTSISHLADQDYALYRALTLLHGLRVLRRVQTP